MLGGNATFKNKVLYKRVSDIFWKVLCNPDKYTSDVIIICIEKFKEFGHWTVNELRGRLI